MKEIVMIGNTHFDPVWLWRWDEAMASVAATFKSALERMEETPDFKYSFSAPCVLEWIRNTEPELFEKIKERILEGRWELAEGWWTQADCNAAMGESYVRQALYAQMYFKEQFGMTSETVFNIDSFGHCATLPQILSKCGIKNYVFWRPEENKDRPLFRWSSGDGSQVTVYHVGDAGGTMFTKTVAEAVEPLIPSCTESGCDYMLVYGVTDHGGAPTKRAIAEIEELRQKYKGSCEIKFGTVKQFFEGQREKPLPEQTGEFQINYLGPYANYTEIKKNNRIAEYAVLNAEKISVIAKRLLGRSYPAKQLADCWKDLMFNQFHDILGGTCIKDAYFDARNLHGRAIQTANEIMHYGMQAVTRRIRTPGTNEDHVWNLVVWNLNGFKAETVIEAEIQWAWEFEWYGDGIVLTDESGREYPCQIIQEQSVIPRFRSRIAFQAELPSMGYRTFAVRQTHTPACLVENPEKGLETDRFRVSYGKDGIQLYDKSRGRTAADALFVPYAVYDDCDTWGFNKATLDPDKQFLKLESCGLTEDGCLRTTMRFVWTFHSSRVEQYLTLCDTFVDCQYRVYWNEEKYVLKFLLTPEAGTPECLVSIPYGKIVREKTVRERPMGEWITLNAEQPVSVLSDSIFSYDFDGRSLGLTALRSCIYGDLRSEPLDLSKYYSYMGQGITEGRMRLLLQDHPEREAVLYNNKPVVVLEANHGGTLEAENSFFETNNSGLLLTAMKQSEKGDGTVLRFYETTGQAGRAAIRLFDRSAQTEYGREEIKTLKWTEQGASEVSMLEE